VVEAFKQRGMSLFLLDLYGGADDVSGNGIGWADNHASG
jgi:hypothetical protein